VQEILFSEFDLKTTKLFRVLMFCLTDLSLPFLEIHGQQHYLNSFCGYSPWIYAIFFKDKYIYKAVPICCKFKAFQLGFFF